MDAIKATGLTVHMLCRIAVCARIQEETGRAICVDDLLADLDDGMDVEPAAAGRFLRDMSRRKMLKRVPPLAGRRCAFYVIAARWYVVSEELAAHGFLPGVCSVCGSRRAVPFPFLKRFFCRACLMLAHRDDYKPKKESSNDQRAAGDSPDGGPAGGDGNPPEPQREADRSDRSDAAVAALPL